MTEKGFVFNFFVSRKFSLTAPINVKHLTKIWYYTSEIWLEICFTLEYVNQSDCAVVEIFRTNSVGFGNGMGPKGLKCLDKLTKPDFFVLPENPKSYFFLLNSRL